MGDVIQLQKGAPPWRPSEDAEVITEYHYHDIPLVGVVRQHDIEYLFDCIWGAEGPVSYWLYAQLSNEERKMFDDASSPEEFDQIFNKLPDRNVVVAVALDPAGILASQVFHSGDRVDNDRAFDRLHRDLMGLADTALDARNAVPV